MPGNLKVLLVNGELDCNGPSGKTVKGENKAGEYLVYPRVLRLATKKYELVSKRKGKAV